MQVAFGSLRTKTTQPMYRLDMEQYLLFTDIDLPTSYRVDFGLSETGDTISMIGTEDGVLIPDNLLINPGTLHAWVWVDTGTYGGKTCYHAIIPVKKRGNVTDIEPTPSEQSTIDTLIRAMNEAVDDAEASATAAEGFAENAEASAERAEQAAQSIDGKVERAEAAAQAAGVSATRAEEAAGYAELYRNESAQSASSALSSAAYARDSKETAIEKATEASNSAAQAAASAASIEGDVQEAEQAAQQATQAANAASQSATAAQGSATAASGSATVATNKAAEASASATTATNKATEAANSATAAQTAQTGAEAAQIAAEAAQQAAEEAAQEAETILVDKAPVITDTASGAIASFPDGSNGLPLKSLVASIEPVQDLHGYDNPWPAGGGKNKLNNTATTTTSNGVTFTVNADGSVSCSGTATGTAVLRIYQTFDYAEDMFLSGCPNGGDYLNGYSMIAANSNGSALNNCIDIGRGETIRANYISSIAQVQIIIRTGINTNGLVFKPMIRLASVTDGTYAPYSNECPISGWTGMNGMRTGKNLLSVSMTSRTVGGIEQSVSNDGTVSLTGTSTALYLGVVGTVKLRAGSYAANGMKSNSFSSTLQIRVGDASGTTLATDSGSGADFVLDKDTTVACVIRIPSGKTLTTPLVVEPMIRLASDSDTTYALYSGETLSVSWQDTAGTVYGGTMTVNEDGSGELVANNKNFAFKDLTTQAGSAAVWAYNSTYNMFETRNNIIPTGTVDEDTGIVCSCYNSKPYGYNSSYATEDSVIWAHTSGTLRVRDTRYTDVNSWKTAIADEQIVVPLATPLTYHFDNLTQLTTVLGTNNIFVDTGDVQCEYRADTKLYLEKLTAPTEDDMIADHAIASGTFFMVGNTLYKALTAIANGATITPGTNAQQLSLADALNLLNT